MKHVDIGNLRGASMRTVSLCIILTTAALSGDVLAADGVVYYPRGSCIPAQSLSQDDGDTGAMYQAGAFAGAFRFGQPNYAGVEGMVNSWSSLKCKFADGRPRLVVLLGAFRRAFQDENNWDASLAKVNALRKAFPDAPFPILAEAQYWASFAWDARGSGYAASVTPDGWKLFQERMRNAEKVLLDNKTVGSTLPNWYDLMIEVHTALGHSANERNATFLEGATRYKTYLQTYVVMRNFLEPKWSGSWKAVDSLIDWSVSNTMETEGQSMYARLYNGVHYNLEPGKSIFKETLVKWPRMKAGFEDMMRLYPDSKANLNDFAALACEAGDKKTFLALRKKIGNDYIESSWQKNYSLELCEAKFGYK